MSRTSQLIRSASLSGFADLARSVGLSPIVQMRKAGLNPRSLQDPEILVNAWSVGKLLENCAHDAGVEDFGLRLAQGRRLSNLGPISIVLREEPSARQALDTLCRYLLLLNGSLITRIEDHENVVIIRQELLNAPGGSVRQAMELAVAVMYRILSELLGPAWRPRWVSFAHRPPRQLSSHKAIFASKIEFDAAFNGIVCASHDLSVRLPTLESGMAPFARRFLDEALSKAKPNAADTARRLIAVTLPTGRCTADQVAQLLGIDRRTLHRHLQAEGETFSSLMQAVRTAIVIRQIRESDRSLAELAELLGFSSASAFAYWFKKQFGCKASEWRDQNQTT